MRLTTMIQRLEFKIVFPVLLISFLFGAIGIYAISHKMNKEVIVNVKKNLKDKADEVYSYFEEDYQTFLEYAVNDKEDFNKKEEALKRKILYSLYSHLYGSDFYNIVVKDENGKTLFKNTNGKNIDESVFTGSTYITVRKKFIPWQWEINVIADKSVYDYIIRENALFVFLTISSIVVFIIAALVMMLRMWLKRPLEEILAKLEQIKRGSNEKITINSTYEMHQLAEYLNDAVSIISSGENDIKNQLTFTRNILDVQESVVVIADMKGVFDANRKFFELFERYGDIEDFKAQHDCICELFLDTGMKGYVRKVNKEDSFHLYREIAANSDAVYKVAMDTGRGARYFSIKASNLFLEKREYFIIVLTDITDTENYRLFLEERVKEAVEKNRENDKIIYELRRQESLTELITNIAHQWRQPLNTVALTLNDLEDMLSFDEIEKERAIKEINVSKEELQYISDVITMFASLNKPNAFKREFSLKNVINDALNILRAELESNGCRIEVDVDESLRVFGSQDQFYDVLKKLIGNSIEHAKDTDTERYIAIKALRSDTDRKIILCIEDNAGGIDEAILDKIFDPYTTTDFQSRGKGLSLYLVKNIIEFQFNGTITAANIDKGARVTIELPLGQA